MKRQKEAIVVFCAHPDDQVFGVGGTIARYAREGKKVYSVIFSYGESSHPWLRKKVTAGMRKKECEEADSILGGSGLIFLGLREGRFKEEIRKKGIKSRLKEVMRACSPSKVFVHSIDDRDPVAGDHRVVHDVITEVIDEMDYKGELYSFEVWNPINIRERSLPRMYVDVSDTFRVKTRALKCFRSQWVAMTLLYWSVYARAITNGIRSGYGLAERFYKLR